MNKIKKKRKFKFKILWIVLFGFLTYQLIQYLWIEVKLVNNNSDFVVSLLQDSNYHLLYKKNNNNIFYKLFNTFNITSEPIKIIKNIFPIKQSSKQIDVINPAFSEKDNPKVYIYNTHQEEKYLNSYFEGYNINPDIMMASQMFQEKLNKLGITTIIEQNSIPQYIKQNNMSFYDSYKVSRIFLEEKLKQYKDLKLIIDLHRDALTRQNSFTTINEEKYAKILFVAGTKYSTYKDNLYLATKIDNKVKKLYPSLTRGVMLKKEKDQNGIYNQDLKSNIILLELGSNNNSIDEINNTLDLLAPIIKEIIDEQG